MPLPLKIPGKNAGASLIPAWHPNFRNASLLPDVKVVRTTFFLNSVAVLVLCTLAVWLVKNEAALHALRGQDAYLDQQIRNEKPGSDRAVALFAKFREQQGYLDELRQFEAPRIPGSGLLVLLGATIPPRVKLGAVDYIGNEVTLRGLISGSADAAYGDLAAYRDAFGHDPAFAGLIDKVTLVSSSRNNTENGVNFTILLTLNPKFPGGAR